MAAPVAPQVQHDCQEHGMGVAVAAAAVGGDPTRTEALIRDFQAEGEREPVHNARYTKDPGHGWTWGNTAYASPV